MIVGEGGGGREKGGRGWIRELGVLFWILDGSKVRIRYTGSGVGMNSLALFPKA